MSVQILSLLVLVCMFVLASFMSINLGILALVAAFLIGSIAGGLDVDALVSGFPGNLFILIVGVTYLFTLAQENGTLQRIIDGAMRLVRNRVAAIPWLMFVLAAFVAAAGALSAASVAIVAPIALRCAAQYKINPMLMGLMVVQGATAGSFSPLSPFGAITNGLLTDNDLPTRPLGLFVNSLLFNVVMAGVVFVIFGGIQLVRDRRRQTDRDEPAEPVEPGEPGGATAGAGPAVAVATETTRATATDVLHQVVTIAAIVGLVASTMLWGLDVGFVALTAAVVVTMLSPSRYADCVKRVPWSPVLLVCGVITYVGVLEQIGTIDWLSDVLTSGGNPTLTALAACYIGGVISAFASTAGVLGASIPLAIPVLEQGMLPMLGTISAIGISSSVVDVSPLSTNGALLVANQTGMDPKVFFRKLLLWSVFVIAVAPLLAWLTFVVL
jgi:Na+/H+ antiporter NhaD/arsenite permease-like protein